MNRMFGVLTAALFVLSLAAVAPSAHATQLDFGCNASTCGSSSVTVTGSNYSSSGISVTNTDVSAPPSYSGSSWTLAFDTSTGNISLTSGLGTISGTILSSAVTNGNSSATLTLQVNWNSLPPAVVTFFGGETSATDLTTVLYLGSSTASGAVNSVGLTMFPTPEPASMILLGSGLLAVGAGLRKKLFAPEA